MSQKIILGFTGLMASGKGTSAAYLQKNYNASTYRFSTILRDLTQRLYLEENRDNLVRMFECVGAAFGQDILSKVIARDAQSDAHSLVIVEGIRRPQDVEYLKKSPNFVLVEIFADTKTRHARLNLRRENHDDATKTFEEFVADHERSTEITIPIIAKEAAQIIDNNGTLKDLYRQLDELVKKYTH